MAPIVIPTRLGWWVSLEVWVLTTVEIVGFDEGGSVGVGVNGFFFFFFFLGLLVDVIGVVVVVAWRRLVGGEIGGAVVAMALWWLWRCDRRGC